MCDGWMDAGVVVAVGFDDPLSLARKNGVPASNSVP